MATLRLLSTYVIFSFLLLSLKKTHASTKTNYHTLELTSFLQPTVCNPSTKGSTNRKASLEVHHRHGPCSQLNQDKTKKNPTLAEILSQDQSRVKSIQTRLAFSKDKLTNQITDEKTTLPAQSGVSLNTLNYIVTVGIGTPKKDLSLIFDTGSDITWTQCEPCEGYCYNQAQEKFDPAKTSSYSNITCDSPLCSQLQSHRCFSSTCVYRIIYGDQSVSALTEGYLAKEKFTLTSTDVIDDISFGCGQYNNGFGSVAGLLGLGRHPLSIVSQTAAKYGKFFSYCLPSRVGSTGHLTFGNNGVPENVKYTPMLNSDTFYPIDVIAISVGGIQLPISATVLKNAGTIIDSGTVLTRLPTPVYQPLRDAFKQHMTSYKTAPRFELLDTCYYLSNHTTFDVPSITFYFSGNVQVDIPANGILISADDPHRMCLAFIESDSSIFGNLQHQTYEVVYDVAGGKIGFAPGGCA